MSQQVQVVVDENAPEGELEVVHVAVATGAHVDEGEPLFEVSTDKADIEIAAPVSGTVAAINVQVGSIVTAGDVLGAIDPS